MSRLMRGRLAKHALFTLAWLGAWAVCGTAAADETPTQDAPQLTTANPPAPTDNASATDGQTPAAICTDRPTKSNFACTVDPGRIQYESDLFNTSILRADGTTTDTLMPVNPTVKYGLNSSVDVEANLAPVVVVHSSSPGVSHTVAGLGDLFVRLKYEFFKSTGEDVQATLLPYWKIPTAPADIGNRKEEGGLLLPLNLKLSDKLLLTTVPEVDALADPVGDGHHLNTAQLINLSLSLPDNFTVYGELWGDWNFLPGTLQRQATVDSAVTYGIGLDLQLDAGFNFGVTANTPRVQAYLGISQRF